MIRRILSVIASIVLSPVIICLLPVIALISIPVETARQKKQRQSELELTAKLYAAGRAIAWSEVAAKLASGQGTLIVEHCSPKGPIREWWTADDLLASTTIPLTKSIRDLPSSTEELEAIQSFAKSCMDTYVDIENGTALMTSVPIASARKRDPRKYVTVNIGGNMITAIMLETQRALAENFPEGKVVTLVDWDNDTPCLFKGDAESVFLPPQGNVAPGSENQR